MNSFTLRTWAPVVGVLALCLLGLLLRPAPETTQFIKKESGAGKALDAWSWQRAYPNTKIQMRSYAQAFEEKARTETTSARNSGMSPWEPIGPKNIGGRTLCLAINPLNPQTIYAGSASGGLWRTRTEGIGVVGWERLDLGHPVLGVSAIVISPADTSVMYIGTGEVYNYQNTAPGIADRITRGSYGIGILKSTDAGNTWTKSLDWSYGDMRGMADMQINPLNPNTIFAATSEGLYRSRDAGSSWQLVHSVLMAMDIEMHAADTSRIYVSHGDFATAGHGLYRSLDGGDSFVKMTSGLPASYTGKSLISISESNPDILYASVANNFFSLGLYRSNNGGNTWAQVNGDDVARWQGWYSHDVAIHPQNPDTLIYVGIDTWKSTNGGSTLTQKTSWSSWDFGQTPVGGPEGPSFYVHADIHAAYFHPTNPNKVLLATDGGVFVSDDIGENWEGRNGSYQCTQFYANFANSSTDSMMASGGMQDNATAIYVGDDSWRRVIGGDGLSAAIDPTDDDIVYGSYQYLGLLKSTDGGVNFDTSVEPPEIGGEETSFAGVYEIATASPNVLYAGRERVYRTSNGGLSWTNVSGAPLDPGNPVISMAIADTDPNFLYAATAPLGTGPAKIFKSSNGGSNWSLVSGSLPDRIATDIAIDPVDKDVAYVTFSGFGSSHVYKTADAGANWTAVDVGLPDVPTNTVCIDPLFPDHIYVGNDLGVYLSVDAGTSWDVFCSGLPEAVLVMHLSVSPANRKLRVATHGNGVYQTPLVDAPVSSIESQLPTGIVLGTAFPNPVNEMLNLPIESDRQLKVRAELLDLQGRRLPVPEVTATIVGYAELRLPVSALASGLYMCRLVLKTEGAAYVHTAKFEKR